MLDPASQISSPAARALGNIGGSESLKYLLRNLSRADAASIESTVRSLGMIGDAAAVMPLVCMLGNVTDPRLKKTIANALKNIAHTTDEQEIIDMYNRAQNTRA